MGSEGSRTNVEESGSSMGAFRLKKYFTILKIMYTPSGQLDREAYIPVYPKIS